MNRMLVSAFFVFSLTACKENTRTVLVSGDSWSFFVCIYKSLETALQSAGVQNTVTNSTCAVTTRIGIRASGWLSSTFHKSTSIALRDPSVKVLYLSLGGNDVMNEWNKNMSAEQETAVFIDIRTRVSEIIDEYQKTRPDVKIIVSGYDYPHFTDNHPVPEYQEGYEQMGKPTPYEMNSALVRFSTLMSELGQKPNVAYIHYLGLMHYHYGNSAEGLEPGATLAPEHISSPENPTQYGGNLQFQTDVLGMLSSNTLGVVDAFHLSKRGYSKVGDHVVYHYLKDWLRTP